MKRAIYILLVASIVLSFILAGCSSTATTTAAPTTPAITTAAPTSAAVQPTTTAPKTTAAATTTPAATSQIVKGGILKLITGGNTLPLGWPPDLVGANEVYTWPLEEALWFRDEKGTLQPWLATSWDTPADWSSITFHLRKGVKFQDGTDFNAAAVKWMLDMHKAVKVGGSDAWGDISVVDEYTVKLNLTKYQNTQELVIGQIKFVSKAAYEKNGLDWMKQNPVGTGSFKIKEYKPSVSLELERNPNYWGPQPYIDGIKYLYISDASTKQSAFLHGDAQVLYYAINDPQVSADLKQKGYDIQIVPLGEVFIAFDQGNADRSLNQNSLFKDVLVRQAVEYALDRDKIAATAGRGFWTPLKQFLQPGMYGYTPLPPREYNPAKAKQLLAAAGYPNGISTTFTASTSTDPTYCDALQSYLGAVGINTKVTLVTGAAGSQLLNNGWTGLMNANIGIWGMEVLERMQFHFAGNQNVSIYKSPEFLSMLSDALSQSDTAKRDKLTEQLAKYMYDNVMVVPVYTQGTTLIQVKGIHNLEFMKVHTLNWWTFNTVWMDKSIQ